MAIDENGEGIDTLFDVMTHTLDNSSGVSDHGKTGIETFLKKHQCGRHCSNFRLSSEAFDCGAGADPDSD
ncbi:hypothetical protein C8R44DRAFT_613350 [Mycena epipterygia]|nr:hypothetical protein C8R44DRAFT_613350 [Mycena epipterygia]